MRAARFDRTAILSDPGELAHVIDQFRAYQSLPEDAALDGAWARLVDQLRAYLTRQGIADAPTMTASDFVHAAPSQDRIDVAEAMQCLSLLLSHDRPQYWDNGAITDLERRLATLIAILSDAEVQHLEPLAAVGVRFQQGRRRGAVGPFAGYLQGVCRKLGSYDYDDVMAHLERIESASCTVGVVEFNAEDETVLFALKDKAPPERRSFKTIRNLLIRLANRQGRGESRLTLNRESR